MSQAGPSLSVRLDKVVVVLHCWREAIGEPEVGRVQLPRFQNLRDAAHSVVRKHLLVEAKVFLVNMEPNFAAWGHHL